MRRMYALAILLATFAAIAPAQAETIPGDSHGQYFAMSIADTISWAGVANNDSVLVQLDFAAPRGLRHVVLTGNNVTNAAAADSTKLYVEIRTDPGEFAKWISLKSWSNQGAAVFDYSAGNPLDTVDGTLNTGFLWRVRWGTHNQDGLYTSESVSCWGVRVRSNSTDGGASSSGGLTSGFWAIFALD